MAAAPPIRTYEEAVTSAAAILSRALTRLAYQTPEEAARDAYVPGGPSVEELADRIRARRNRACQRAA